MDKILEELWYGNIDPMEAVGSGCPQYKELMELIKDAADSLRIHTEDTSKPLCIIHRICGNAVYQVFRLQKLSFRRLVNSVGEHLIIK